jgi:hypothetical protein
MPIENAGNEMQYVQTFEADSFRSFMYTVDIPPIPPVTPLTNNIVNLFVMAAFQISLEI